MGAREQLLKEHSEWTVKYVKAHEQVVALLPPVADVSRGERLIPWIPTVESLAEFDRAKNNEEVALAKLHEIMDRLWRLHQKGQW